MKIKNILTLNSVNRLQKASSRAIDVFTKTIEQLENINEEIESEISKKETKISLLQNESKQLKIQQTGNINIVSKIKTILS